MKSKYPLRTTLSFLLVLFLMPIGHALMILMEHFMSTTTLHYAAFSLGLLGVFLVIVGIFTKGDTRQTLFGLIGGLLFWTGWVEFLFAYYAWRYGVHCDLVGSGIIETTTTYVDGIGVCHDFLINGQPLEHFTRPELKAIRGSRPEYLILPATFGLWMMFCIFYIFSTRTGCLFFNWLQRHLHLKGTVEMKPTVRNASMVTFMELNVMLWGMYLLLMFCYDPVFLGTTHPVTFALGLGCLVAASFMFARELRLKAWGANIRMAIATVLIFWNFVEITARNGFFNEIWVDPLNYLMEMSLILLTFVAITVYLIYQSRTKR